MIQHSLLVLSFVLAFSAFAGEKQTPQDEARSTSKVGGVWVSPKAPKMKVKVNPTREGFHISVNPGPIQGGEKTPSSIGFTFVDSDGKRTTVELKASEPLKDPTQYEGSSTASVNNRSQNFIGFEIKIPFGSSEKPTVVRSDDLEKLGP